MPQQELALALLSEAIAEVAQSPQSQRKLARAACVRPNCESEWVYELDGTKVMESAPMPVAREVTFARGQRADMRIGETLVEFKSTKPWYAVRRSFASTTPPRRISAEYWLGRDITRMAAADGLFVLIVSAGGPVTNKEFLAIPEDQRRAEGVDRYRRWLSDWSGGVRPGVTVTEIDAGTGVFAGHSVQHDALVVSWDKP
jgi:hypothetical protein